MAFGGMTKEQLARWLVFILVVGFSAAAVIVRWRDQGIEVHAAMPEAGGWMPENLTARVGEPLNLRLISDDVMHSFAIGQSDREPVDVLPGVATEITLIFDQPGTYTFYCTRWCGANHWRMRGTITIEGENLTTNQRPPDPPLFVTLEIDLDEPHTIEDIPEKMPSSQRGEVLINTSALDFRLSPKEYRSQAPHEVWLSLRENPATQLSTDAELWDVVAAFWEHQTSAEKLQLGAQLFAQNCAACHGVSGAGDGIFAQPVTDASDSSGMISGHELVPATDFTQANTMLGASSALLQGKILRGGMGTGMPSWGQIFTDEQTWALIDYLWTFLFNYEE
jgi:mono/diheme cytochrome c family protein/plastocyanin